jgi:hypothetical protein
MKEDLFIDRSQIMGKLIGPKLGHFAALRDCLLDVATTVPPLTVLRKHRISACQEVARRTPTPMPLATMRPDLHSEAP